MKVGLVCPYACDVPGGVRSHVADLAGAVGDHGHEVSVLAPDEPVSGLSDLDPKHFGVIVSDGAGRRGLLLPDIDGVDDAATQVAIARQKAGIGAGAPVRLSRFRVTKAKEA